MLCIICFFKENILGDIYIVEGYFAVANMRVCVKRSFLQKIKPSLEFVILNLGTFFFNQKLLNFFVYQKSFEFFFSKNTMLKNAKGFFFKLVTQWFFCKSDNSSTVCGGIAKIGNKSCILAL